MPSSKKSKKSKKSRSSTGGNGSSINNGSINNGNGNGSNTTVVSSSSNTNVVSSSTTNVVSSNSTTSEPIEIATERVMSNPQDDIEPIMVNGRRAEAAPSAADSRILPAVSNSASASTVNGGTATTSTTSGGGGEDRYYPDPSIRFHHTVIVLVALLSLIIPTLWSVVYGRSAYYADSMAENRTLPKTWEGLKQETHDTFQVGFTDLELPTFYLESIHGFEMVFLDETGFYSWQYFLERTGNTDVTGTPWTVPLSKMYSVPVGTASYRNLTYLHPVSNPLAPPLARATKRQRLEHYQRRYALLQTWTEVQDVPFADCFIVEDRLLVEIYGSKNITVSAYFRIDFTKDTMFRSVIEQQTVKEHKDLLREYSQFLKLVSFGHPASWNPTVTAAAAAAARRSTKSTTTTADNPPQSSDRKRPFHRVGSAVSLPFRAVGTQLGRFTRFVGRLGKKDG